MSEFIRNDPIATRYAILYEFAKGKPIFESYQELCKTLKDDSFDYQEFEFWFMKFARNEFDVNYDRSLDPKCRSFSELPVDIFKKFGDYLSFDDRYNLRTMSKNIRNIVDSWKPNVVNLLFEKKMSDQERLKYAYLLKNPKLDLDSLEVYHDDKRSSELVVSLLKRVEHVIRVRKFTITVALSDAPLIISKLDPRVLDDLEIRLKDEYFESLDTILQLEQIKGLKYFYILTKLDTHEFPLHCFLTYPVFSIVYDEATDLKPIVAFIRKLLKNSSNLKNCYFFFRNERFRQSYLRKSFSRLGMPVPFPGFRNYRHIPIPGSTDVYELEFSDRDISIERKKKEEVDYGSSSDSSDSDN